MIWKRSKTKTNDGKDIPCWEDTQGMYIISQNINGGDVLDETTWLFEISRKDRNEEISVGVEETLKHAKAVAEADAKKIVDTDKTYP